jgi:hypothetical protein
MKRASSGEDAAGELSRLLSTRRYCLRVSDTEACRECLNHKKTSRHFPSEVFWRQIPGQPRAVARFCGECGTELQVSS